MDIDKTASTSRLDLLSMSELPSSAARQKLAKVILNHDIITRTPGLLPMQYNVVELAAAINMPAETIRDWAQQTDMPHTRDTREHIWIDGQAFRVWVARLMAARQRVKLQEGEAYCCSCNRAVTPTQSEERIREIKHESVHPNRPTRTKLHWRKMLMGTCPNCGHKVNRVLVCGR